MASQDDSLKQVARSGLPFQLRVEHEVRSTSPLHRWSVSSREHPWVNPETGSSGFIDLVLRHDRCPIYRLVIECKRIKADDARQLRWIFLLPDAEPTQTELASCLEVEGRLNRHADPPDVVDMRLWDDVCSTPASEQSEFCVLPNDEQRKPILESLAAGVLDSIEGLAQEEVNIAKSQSPPYRLRRLFIFPVIVTNAEIAVCRFDSGSIRIDDGTIDPVNVEFTAVPFIRFRKSLAKVFPYGSFDDLQSANRARQRTVFVVNAASISEFLTGWDMHSKDPSEGFAIERIPWNQKA